MKFNTIRIILITFILMMNHFAFAQQPAAQIKGMITDQDSAPIDMATVVLFSLPDSIFVRSEFSDESGSFVFDQVAYGNYYLTISSVGYDHHVSESFVLTQEQPTIYKNVSIHFAMTDEIVISGEKPLIQQQAGITVVNVENGILNSGLYATDVLKRTPGVTVDKDGIVKLKGKDGVLVMLDGKPLYMDAAQVGTLLKSIPADQIKEMEVITSPSAKYDAAGNAGIINITLKQGAYEGLNGTVNGAIGRGLYPKANTGISLSYKKKKLALSGGYQYNYKKNLDQSVVNRQYTDFADSSFYTSSRSVFPEYTQNVLLNGSYALSSKGTVLFDGNVMYESYSGAGTSHSDMYAPSGNRTSYFQTKNASKGETFNMNSSLGYKHVFDTTGTELFVQGEYKTNERSLIQTFGTDYYTDAGTSEGPSLSYESSMPSNYMQWGGKADFIKMLPYKIKMETGVKMMGIENNTNVNSTFNASNHFIYTEQIQAAYLMLNNAIGKWKLSGGLRVEHTKNKGVQESIDSTFNRNYTNLFPSASVSYQSSPKTEYTLLYSKRIERPSYHVLNPFVYYSDPYNRYAGNPYILPQYTHQTEFTVSKWHGVLLASVNYSYTNQPQSNVFIFDSTNLVTTYTERNLVSQENVGLSLSVNTSVRRWWAMNNYVYLYNNTLKGDVGYGMVRLSRSAWMVNMTHTFKMPYKLSAEVSFNYESPNYFGTMLYREVWQLSAGVQKKFINETLSVKLSVTDIFWKYVYVGQGDFGSIHTSDQYKWDNRVLMLSVSYRFGKNMFQRNTEEAIVGGSAGRKR